MINTVKHSKTIFRQVLIFSLLISLVPIILVSIILFRNLESTAEKELTASYKQIGLQYINNIKDRLTCSIKEYNHTGAALKSSGFPIYKGRVN